MSKNFVSSFCGLRTNPRLFLQDDNERDAALKCISKQISNGSWTNLVDLLMFNRDKDHCFDPQFQLTDERYNLL